MFIKSYTFISRINIIYNYNFSSPSNKSINMSKVLTVFGATGKQGGSVVQTILTDKKLSREFTIRAVSRDINKPAAKELAAKGVEMVAARMMETLYQILR
jgi:hypothetical protein